MANKLTNAEARALSGANVDIAPHMQYPHDGAQSGDPVAEKFDFFQKLVQAAYGVPRVADPLFAPPIVFRDDFFSGGAELNPVNTDDPETDGEGFKFGTVNELNDWYVGGTNAATGAIAVENDAIGGWVSLTTAGAEEDALQAQLLGAPFLLAANKPLYFEARIMIEDVSECTWFVGLAIKDCTEVTGSGTWGASDDCIGFYGIEEVNINYASSEDGTDTAADTGSDIADGSIATISTKAVRLGFLWDGDDTVTFYVDGVSVATISATDDDVNQDEYMSPMIAIDATAGGTAEVLFIDYLFVVQER